MRMKVPITGTVKEIVNGIVIGDDKDGIRPVDINLGNGNVSWRMIKLDIENEEMEIEVTPAPKIRVGEVVRDSTPAEKAEAIEYARDRSLERMTKDNLYRMSKSPRLKNPFKVEP